MPTHLHRKAPFDWLIVSQIYSSREWELSKSRPYFSFHNLTFFIVLNNIKTGRFTEEQLARAKTQLCSEILRNMESRPYMMEDFVRSTQQFGTPSHPIQTCDFINQVSRGDLIKEHGIITLLLQYCEVWSSSFEIFW